MNIAICDDEMYFRQKLNFELNENARLFGFIFLIFEFSNGSDLLASNVKFDLIFMDYQMKNKNGIDTVETLRKRNDDTKVVFISSFKEMVFESMKVRTFRFLIKPLDTKKLHEALDAVIKEQLIISRIIVKDEENQKNVTVPECDIIYAQADNIYADIATINGIYKYMNNITALQNELNSDYFYRTNRSYLVNFNYIINYTNKEIEFTNGHKAVISKTKYKNFKSAYLTYLKRKSIGE